MPPIPDATTGQGRGGSGPEAVVRIWPFGHIIGAGEDRGWAVEAKRLSGPEVDGRGISRQSSKCIRLPVRGSHPRFPKE